MDGLTDEEIFELWNERAAIREYEGEQDRKTAEQEACGDLRNMFGSAPAWLVEMILQRN